MTRAGLLGLALGLLCGLGCYAAGHAGGYRHGWAVAEEGTWRCSARCIDEGRAYGAVTRDGECVCEGDRDELCGRWP